MAFAANNDNFILGILNNKATAITRLVGNVAGGPALHIVNNKTDAGSRALQLGVAKNKPPIVVNATAGKATNLNADKVDGKDASEIGISGVERHALASVSDSVSPKRVSVKCTEGMVLVGNSGYVIGGNTGSSPNGETDVSLVTLDAFAGEAVATAWENDPTDANWTVVAVAQCATRP